MIQPVVYNLDNKTVLSEEMITRIGGYLPASRLEKAERYLRTVDRNNCIISFFLLLCGLLENYGIRTMPEISVGQHGKPYFKDIDVSFSISYCDSGVCCGIYDRNLGVDIQDTDIEFEEILNISMSCRERKLIERFNAACATGLVGINLAVRSLENHECDHCVVAAASIEPCQSGYYIAENAISSDGRTCAYDRNGTGFVPGSGVAAVVLKRYGDAVKDGDNILGVIKGVAVGNDGNRKIGFAAPSIRKISDGKEKGT
ncbi:4'-phosphopantetheinyl transferase superfamily protein [Ruminococcus flavefaciens]|uniref:4'-phosphopantetheinyl transferase family protein n=1 Tax=Ruminococcus flavefaciens TaxID=1265 RepID=UPI001566A74C|nr:beta-ketoacyl synthase N-terminal-like domain-containing protein [Ruminococcus flavefaciens]